MQRFGVWGARDILMSLCAVLGLACGGAAASQEPLSAEDAMRLMTLDEQLQAAQAEALASDAAYQKAQAAAEEAQQAWAAHQATFEAQRDADPDFQVARSSLADLEQRQYELEQQKSDISRTRRGATNTIRTAQRDIAKARSGIATLDRNRRKYQGRYDQLLKSWQEGDEDDTGTNRSGTRLNSLNHLQEQIDELEAQIEAGQSIIAAAEKQIAESEPVAASITAELEGVDRALLEIKAELPAAQRKVAEVEGKWMGPFLASPKTRELEEASRRSAKHLDLVAAEALKRLRQGGGSYAQLYRERVAIRAFDH